MLQQVKLLANSTIKNFANYLLITFSEVELIDKFGGDPRDFIADHPFLFYIEDDTTGAKVFSGIVNNPEY